MSLGPAGTVEVDVKGDFTEFERGLDRSGSTHGGNYGRGFGQGFGRTVANLGATYLGAAFARSTIGAASDLAEATNVTGLAFGSARGQADQFATGAADAIGMSEAATRAMQAQLGNVMVGFGTAQGDAAQISEDLIRRAADVGSAWNAGTGEVTEAIIAAFTTSTEPIRKFGVIIDQAAIKQKALDMGLIDAGGELDNYSKMQAVTALVMEQTNNVAGDFANTQEGVANSSKTVKAQWTDMQAQLGQGLLPVLSGVLGVMRDLGPEGMQMVVMGGLLVVGIVKIAEAGRALSGIFSLLAANPWFLAIGALVVAGVLLYKNWDEVKAKGQQLIGWFEGAAGSIAGAFSGVGSAIVGPVKAAFNGIAQSWNATIGKFSVSVPGWVPGLGGKGWDMPDIPTMAAGGLASSPMLAMIGEYPGASANPEVVSPVDTMRATFLDALAESGAQTDGGFTINGPLLVVEGNVTDGAYLERHAQTIARVVRRVINDERAALGVPTGGLTS